MRVLHLLPNLRREGAQVFVHNLVTCAGAENAEYVVCAWQQGGALLEAFQRGAVPAFVPARTHRFSTPWRTLGFIDEVIAGNEIHLIHAHMPDAAVWGWFAAKRRGLPLLITYHSNKLLARSNPVWSCVRFFSLPLAARYAQCNIAISASIGERVRRSLALPSTRVCIVPNGVQIPAWNAGETIRERNSTSACIVAVGRLVELKSHEQLIRAAAILVEQHQSARFLIVGDGPLRERLRQQVASLGLSENVIFTGASDDVAAYLRQADVYVTMSRYEGMPLATLEAMACGVPVVASDVPGHGDLLEHGVNALLYPFGDISALAGAVNRVLEQPEAARNRALRARQLVEASYSIDAAAGNYERLYTQILAR